MIFGIIKQIYEKRKLEMRIKSFEKKLRALVQKKDALVAYDIYFQNQ